VRRSGHLLSVIVLAGCAPNEAPRVELPVVVDGSGVSTAATDLGWTVELEQARVAIADLRFTTAGEVHMEDRRSSGAQLLGFLSETLISSAHAHPGHFQGGQIIGELPGTFVVDYVNEDGRELGLATMIVGEYTALDFLLARAGTDEVEDGDPLFGHTALLSGTASAAEGTVAFTIVIDSPADRSIVGAPFEVEVVEDSSFEIGLRMLSTDPFEEDHLFDGIDFAQLDALDGAADGVLLLVDPDASEVEVGPELAEAYYNIRRDFQTHDLFDAIAREP
jgi:hypothetical protein